MSEVNGCKCRCDEEKQAKLLDIIERHKSQEGGLIPVLHEAQDLYGYLPFEVQKTIAEKMNIPLAEVYGVVTFYKRFSVKPKGKNQIHVCLGTACYVKGSQKILDKISEKLGIQAGECTEDGKFSLDSTRCLGACGLAPVMMVNKTIYGKVTPDKVEEILAKYDS